MREATKSRWARLVCMAAWACVAASAHAAQAAWKQDMVCGADAQRPDRQPALAQRYVLTPDGAIAYYRFGHGSPIVLVTGYRATIANWNAYFLGELAQRHEVIVFDNRGIGKSTSTSARYGVEDLAQDTMTLIQTLRLRRVTLVGWSMGGMIAQSLLVEQPPQVREAVLMTTMPPGPRGQAVPADVMRVLSGSAGAGYAQVMAVLFPPNVEEQAIRCFASDMFRPADYGSVSIPSRITQSQDALLNAWSADQQAYGRLREIAVPTLVLSAQNDEVLAPRNGAVLHDAIFRSSLLEAADAGHAMMYQYPRDLARRISEFIDSGK